MDARGSHPDAKVHTGCHGDEGVHSSCHDDGGVPWCGPGGGPRSSSSSSISHYQQQHRETSTPSVLELLEGGKVVVKPDKPVVMKEAHKSEGDHDTIRTQGDHDTIRTQGDHGMRTQGDHDTIRTMGDHEVMRTMDDHAMEIKDDRLTITGGRLVMGTEGYMVPSSQGSREDPNYFDKSHSVELGDDTIQRSRSDETSERKDWHRSPSETGHKGPLESVSSRKPPIGQTLSEHSTEMFPGISSEEERDLGEKVGEEVGEEVGEKVGEYISAASGGNSTAKLAAKSSGKSK